MKTSVLRIFTLAVAAWLVIVGVCCGDQVYLQDGGIIECESFWRHGDTITVEINPESVIKLGREEVDLKRTFSARKQTAPVKLRNTAGGRQPSATTAPAGFPSHIPVAAVTIAASAEHPQTPPAAAPATKAAPPPAPDPVSPPTASIPPEPAQAHRKDASPLSDKAGIEWRLRGASRFDTGIYPDGRIPH